MAKAELFQKDIPKEERVFYYESEEDDPIKTNEQEQKIEVGLPEGYEFIPRHFWVRMYSAVLFRLFWVFGQWYERRYWQAKFYGQEKLAAAKGRGFVLYCNHTNPFHDVFGPAVAAKRRIFTVISPVNLLIPGIGKFLPMIGGMPLGKTRAEKQAFNEAVDKRLGQKKVLVIYPEAHVWPYHTGVRKFPAGGRSFKYAVRNKLPVYTMTTTYHKRKDKKRGELPRMDVYIDGPFWPDEKLSDVENQEMLAEKVFESMEKHAKKSTYEYFRYIKRGKADVKRNANKKKGNGGADDYSDKTGVGKGKK
ncbi:1-acyl-sn-glycerol-3-phosphate acyltransferase [Candidatus Saccharibacteria bacterium]|nr:1-acyl-sn-glycerol-3-phosphate acyltransferase [Candidatus Saccharibacteria bacterium]